MPFFSKSPTKWGRCRKNCHNECQSTPKHARANRNCEHKYLCVSTETDGNHLIRPYHVDLKGTTAEKEGVELGGAKHCGPRCREPVMTPLLSEDVNWGRPFTSQTLLHCTGFQCKLPRGYGQQPGLVIKLPSWQYCIVFSVMPLLLP